MEVANLEFRNVTTKEETLEPMERNGYLVFNGCLSAPIGDCCQKEQKNVRNNSTMRFLPLSRVPDPYIATSTRP